MGVYMRAADLTRAQQKRFDSMKLTQKAAHIELVQQGKNDHFGFTSGGVTSKQLKQMGHPFARVGAHSSRGIVSDDPKRFLNAGRQFDVQETDRKGNVRTRRRGQVTKKGAVNPLPINRQTGALRRSFFSSGPQGANHVVRMGFRAKHAKYVLSPTGTKKMIYRGFYSKSATTKNLSDLGIIAQRHRARSAALRQSLRARNKKP